MADLITATQAKLRIGQASYTSDENTLIDALVTACSKAAEKYCRRTFDSQDFDETHDPTAAGVCLRRYPVVSVSRVSIDPTDALSVRNTAAAVQLARASVTSTGLSLTRVASGVSTTSTLAFASHVTLSALATAVTALGNGWTAEAAPGLGDYPSADLYAPQGSLDAKGVAAALRLFAGEASDFDLDAARGLLTFRGGTPGPVRVRYAAGYATVPEDVQAAVATWVAWSYQLAKRDPALATKSVVPTSGDTTSSAYLRDGMPAAARVLLDPYRTIGI